MKRLAFLRAPAPFLSGFLSSFFKRHWPRVLAVSVLVVVLLGNQGFRGLLRNWRELKSLRREIVTLEREEGRQARRLDGLKAGDGAIERLARRDLGYIRKGEIEYRFPPPAAESE